MVGVEMNSWRMFCWATSLCRASSRGRLGGLMHSTRAKPAFKRASPTNFDNVWRYHSVAGGIVYVACICICGGIGLLMSYRAERNAEQPKEKKVDEFQV